MKITNITTGIWSKSSDFFLCNSGSQNKTKPPFMNIVRLTVKYTQNQEEAVQDLNLLLTVRAWTSYLNFLLIKDVWGLSYMLITQNKCNNVYVRCSKCSIGDMYYAIYIMGKSNCLYFINSGLTVICSNNDCYSAC